MKPKVLVATPTTNHKQYILATWLWTVQHLTYENYDILLVDNSDDNGKYAGLLKSLGVRVIRSRCADNPHDQITCARNVVRDYALENGYDYWLSLESDVIPPLDIIERLLAHNTEYVSTVQRNFFVSANGTKINKFIALSRQSTEGPRKGRYYHINEEELTKGPLITVERSHLGCTLIKTSLLDTIVFRHDGYQGNDYLLCDDLREQNIRILIDTTIPITHVTDGTTHARIRQWDNNKHNK